MPRLPRSACLADSALLAAPAQVMADAADVCMRQVLYYCQSAKLVPIIVNAGTKDRNPKLRQYCAQYLIQARACTPAEQRCRRLHPRRLLCEASPRCSQHQARPSASGCLPPQNTHHKHHKHSHHNTRQQFTLP